MIYGVRHQNNLMTTRSYYSIELNIRCFWMFLAVFHHHFISRKRPGQHLRKSLRRLPSEYPDSLSNQSLRSFDQIVSSIRGGKVNKTCKLVITLQQLTWQVLPLKNRPFAAAKEGIVSLNHQFSGVNSLWKFQGGALSPKSLQNGPLPNRLILAYWSVDDPTQFKNIVVELDHFPYSRDDNSKNI